ncbi:MAG TPA: UbiA family prenyltransferase [Longimicrobium sp.]|nr:UbiA family prenyltransferase [Longimicrobium sp.]
MEESPAAAPAPRRAARAPRAFLVMLARENLLLALAMGGITAGAQVMEELPAEPLSPLIVALAFYAIYSLDRAGDADADGLTHPERARFSRRNARRMRVASLVAYALALALAATRGGLAIAIALLPLAALLLYSFRIVPPKLARRVGFARIKEIFVLKNVWVAATLAGTATLLPIATAGAVPRWPAAAAMGGFLFGRWWINTLVFDLRDEAGDRANGLRTVPVVLGRARTLHLLHAGNVALAAATIAVPLLGWARPLFALLAASSVYAWIYLRAIAAGGDLHFLCDVVADGELLLLSVLILLVSL